MLVDTSVGIDLERDGHAHLSHLGPPSKILTADATWSAIGWIECRPRYRYEAPRQGVFGRDNVATLRLVDDANLRAGLRGLEGFERVWIVFLLHLNENWRPSVRPPRMGAGSVGVFASRSPHRPNRIGMSCVELVSVESDGLVIRNHDLLDRTPVLDIKPYLPYADAFPGARCGWLEDVPLEGYSIDFSTPARARADWIAAQGAEDIENFVHIQLGHDPDDGERKRIRPLADGRLEIAYRTWRIEYRLSKSGRHIELLDIRSGYSPDDLGDASDPHGDKGVHRAFVEVFGAL